MEVYNLMDIMLFSSNSGTLRHFLEVHVRLRVLNTAAGEGISLYPVEPACDRKVLILDSRS